MSLIIAGNINYVSPTFWPFSFVWGAEHRADLEDLVNLGIAREQRPTEIFFSQLLLQQLQTIYVGFR